MKKCVSCNLPMDQYMLDAAYEVARGHYACSVECYNIYKMQVKEGREPVQDEPEQMSEDSVDTIYGVDTPTGGTLTL